MTDEQAILPLAGEIWRTKSGRLREVSFVNADDLQDGGRWASVGFIRPRPAQENHQTVTLKSWWEWVALERAIRIVKTWRAA